MRRRLDEKVVIRRLPDHQTKKKGNQIHKELKNKEFIHNHPHIGERLMNEIVFNELINVSGAWWIRGQHSHQYVHSAQYV